MVADHQHGARRFSAAGAARRTWIDVHDGEPLPGALPRHRVMSRALDRLAAIAGIEPSFIDYWGRETIVSDETKRALLATMGFDTGDVRDLQPSPDAEPTQQERLQCYLPPA